MTSYTFDLNFQPLTTAEAILNDLCMNTALLIESENLSDGFCNIFIPVSKKVTVFAEVQIDTFTNKTVYYVTSSKNQASHIPALTYTQAVSKLQALLA